MKKVFVSKWVGGSGDPPVANHRDRYAKVSIGREVLPFGRQGEALDFRAQERVCRRKLGPPLEISAIPKVREFALRSRRLPVRPGWVIQQGARPEQDEDVGDCEFS